MNLVPRHRPAIPPTLCISPFLPPFPRPFHACKMSPVSLLAAWNLSGPPLKQSLHPPSPPLLREFVRRPLPVLFDMPSRLHGRGRDLEQTLTSFLHPSVALLAF